MVRLSRIMRGGYIEHAVCKHTLDAPEKRHTAPLGGTRWGFTSAAAAVLCSWGHSSRLHRPEGGRRSRGRRVRTMRVCPVWFWDLAGWFVKALPIFGSGLISSCQRDELERDVA